MLDKNTMKNLDKYAENLLKQKKLEHPNDEVEIVYIPVVVTKINGKVACISNNNMNLIK
jgi:hypothetical protein